MADQQDPRDDQNPDRPSFTSFWKKGKETMAGKQITFVQSGTAPPGAGSGTGAGIGSAGELAGDGAGAGGVEGKSPCSNDESAELSPQDKAQIRRAQVRRAQIQHRQRKANYIKQLELDVMRIRDMIAQTERETVVLRRENEAMKARLVGSGTAAPQPHALLPQQPLMTRQQQPVPSIPQQLEQLSLDQDSMLMDYAASPPQALDLSNVSMSEGSPSVSGQPPDLFANIDVNDLTVTLSMDDILGTPCYQVSSSASSMSSGYSPGSPPGFETPAGDAAGLPPLQRLTPEQEGQAINFILALEHICWDHFRTGNFAHDHGSSSYIMGHALMASTYCLSQAPPNVFEANKAFKKFSIPSPFSSSSAASTSSSATTAAGKSASPVISWQASGLSLQALYGLASSLCPGDSEVTPVQAWFELAAQYPADLLLSRPVLDALKREFLGVVKCIHFGAVMERDAYESVVGRVMGRFAPEMGVVV